MYHPLLSAASPVVMRRKRVREVRIKSMCDCVWRERKDDWQENGMENGG